MSLLIIIFYLFLNILIIKVLASSFITSHEKDKNIAEAFKSIIIANKAFIKTDIYLTIGFNKEKPENKILLNDLADMILDKSELRAIVVLHQLPIVIRNHKHYRILLVDDITSMRYAYKNLLRYGTRNLSYTLIYLSSIREVTDSQITEAFELCWQLYILNVGIIVRTQHDEKKIVLLTYFPYTPTSCELIKPTILSRYNETQGLWNLRNCFPEKVHNFHGCPLKCATFEDMPFMQVQRNANGEIIDFSGIEGKLINFMAENLNYTPVLYMMNNEEIMEARNESESIFEKLFTNDIWYAVAAFYNKPDPQETAPFSQTKYYFVRSVYLIFNNGKQNSQQYKILIRPLQTQVWLIIGLLFVIGFAVIFASGCINANGQAFIIGYKNMTPYYNMFVTSVGGIISVRLPRRNFARYLLTLWLISTFVLRGAYQSGLYGILRDQQQDEPPQTLADVGQRKYIIEMKPENVRFLPSLPEIKHVRLLHTTELQAFPQQAVTTERTAILTPYEYFGYFRITNQSISRNLNLLNERIFSLPLSIFVRRNSFLIELLNDQIALSKNYGFFNVWTRQYMTERLERELGNGRASRMVTRNLNYDINSMNKDTKLIVLSLRELETIFYLHSFLLILACEVFVSEFFYNKWRKLTQSK